MKTTLNCHVNCSCHHQDNHVSIYHRGRHQTASATATENREIKQDRRCGGGGILPYPLEKEKESRKSESNNRRHFQKKIDWTTPSTISQEGGESILRLQESSELDIVMDATIPRSVTSVPNVSHSRHIIALRCRVDEKRLHDTRMSGKLSSA